MKKLFAHIIILFIVIIPVAFPIFALAQGNAPSLIVCDGVTEPCTFKHVIELAQAVMNFLLYISTFIAAGMFIYSGFLYVTAGDDSGKVTTAKGIFKSVALGYIIMLSAWVIVYTLVNALSENPEYLKYFK